MHGHGVFRERRATAGSEADEPVKTFKSNPKRRDSVVLSFHLAIKDSFTRKSERQQLHREKTITSSLAAAASSTTATRFHATFSW